VHVGLCGAGRIGSFHARTLQADARVDRLTITDSDSRRASTLANELDAGCADTPAALLDAGIDALVIAAATPAHVELLLLAAEARCPTFCEKPIALDLPTTDAVVDRVRRTGTFVQIGFHRRFDAAYVAARQAVSSGSVGRVHEIRMATHDPTPPPEPYVAASGGIWLDLAIHDFDIGSWVIGSEVLEVYADGQAHDPLFERHDDVDAACALLRYNGDILGVLTAARNDPRGYDVRMEVFGLQDSVAVGVDPRTPLRSLEPGVTANDADGYGDFLERFRAAYQAELAAFLDAVVVGGASPCTVDEARRAQVVAIAADRSRREHRPIRIDEIA
jgi:myo-inositol 2-dehydrogenase / D-chiro-inositol 1-dehydrogenase